MATIDLPDNLVQTLSLVLNQLQQVLPEPKQETDFTAPAFRWENQQLKPFIRLRIFILMT